MLEPIIENIPKEIQCSPQWVCWKARPKANGRTDKLPYDPKNGGMSDSTDPSKWGTFNQAVSAYQNGGGYAGIGFALNGPPFIGVDLDDSVNPETGTIEMWAWEIVEALDTYAEVSPSGTGLRMFLLGELPPGRRRKGKIEVYDSGRYLTVTGHHVEGTPRRIMERNQEMSALYEKVFSECKSSAGERLPAYQTASRLGDDDIISRANTGKDELLGKLWAGDIAEYKSHSEADQALCNKLAFYTGKNPEQMDRLFRQSGLYRQKWERDDYRARTIGTAIRDVREIYTGGCLTAGEAFGELDWDGSIIKDESNKKPSIQANHRYLDSITKQALAALDKNNHPAKLFIRNGEIVRIRKIQDKGSKGQSVRRPVIERLNEHALRGHLARSANFVNVREGRSGELIPRPAVPPMEVVRDIMGQPSVPFPLLKGIVQAPILRYDGSLFDKPGYDTVSSLYYSPRQGLTSLVIPDHPTASQIQGAVTQLCDIICDFPFDSSASVSNTLAAIMTPVLRDFIAGPVPLLLIDKPLQGTGATLLTNLISVIATGGNAYITTLPDGKGREEEFRKRITAILMEGQRITVIDNVEGVLRSATLCGLLTSEKWQDRILGTNKQAYLDNYTCWMATGNNVRLAGDMPRRCYLVRLDAELAKPWERDTKKFRYQDLLQHVKKNRGALLAAIYTMARGWIQAGRQAAANAPIMGSFENWRNTIGGMLEFAGVYDFLSNNKMVHDNAEVNEGIEPFIEAWHEAFDSKGTTTRELKRQMVYGPHGEELREALPDWLDPDEKGFTRKLGTVLAKKAGVVFTNGFRLVKDGELRRAIRWKVLKV